MRVVHIGLVVTAVAAGVLAATVTVGAQVRGNVYLKTVRVTALPTPPSGDWWDSDVVRNLGGTLGAIFSGRSPDLYPDLEVCIGSRRACRLVCVNAQLNADDPALRPFCGLQLEQGLLLAELVDINGQPQVRPRDLVFEVNEIAENGNTANRRSIGRIAFYAGADPPILQPDRCSESEPCTRSVETERGPLTMSFTTVVAGVVGTLPPPTLPPPTLPGAPSVAPNVSAPPSTTAPTTAPTAAPTAPPEPEGWLSGLWSSFTEPVRSWWAGEQWIPFVQGAGDTYPSHQTTAAQKMCCIHPDDVIQGWYNDCFVLSALAAVAMVSPGTIRNAIHDLGGGVFEIKFAGAAERRRITVDTAVVEVSTWESFDLTFPRWWWPIPSGWEIRQPYEHAQPADDGVEVWPILLERAYGEMFGTTTATGEMPPISEVFKHGGDAGVVMGHVTGRASTNILLAPTSTLPQGYNAGDIVVNFHEVVSTSATLRSTMQRLELLHRQNRVAITAGSIGPCQANPQWDPGVRWKPGEDFRCGALRADLVANHAYYFKNYDDTTQRVELGNPFGRRDASLTLGEFGAWFRSIHYNTLPAVLPDCDCSVK